MKNYNTLLKNVKMRSNPQNKTNLTAVVEGLGLPYSDLSEYIKLAMIGVPEEYTAKSKEVANNVIQHLKNSHGSEVEFRFQGSVETNTHILSENDVDVVQISKKSFTAEINAARSLLDNNTYLSTSETNNLKQHVNSFYEYTGNQLTDLYILRLKSEDVLQQKYTDVDITKPKAICVNVKTPLRNVDVVTANEYRDINFLKNNDAAAIGIRVYNKSTHSLLPLEFPFLSIKLINEKSKTTTGRLKKMIRFLKNVKYDSAEITGRKPSISSFDINAICFDIDVYRYHNLSYMQLVLVIYEQLNRITKDSIYSNNLKSVDGQEYIFKDKPEKLVEMKLLIEVVENILTDVRTLKLIN